LESKESTKQKNGSSGIRKLVNEERRDNEKIQIKGKKLDMYNNMTYRQR
jgi:hypothetical protein